MKKTKLSDLKFEDLFRREPEAGRLFFNNRRALIFDAATMGVLRRQLLSTMGWELAMGVLSRFGYEHGSNDAEMLGRKFNWETDTDWLASGPFLHTLEGLVHVTPQKIEFDRGTGHFHMHGIWLNSYEAETHLKLFGLSAAGPVCWTLAGYASGYASSFFGKSLLAIETECVGKGDARCYFEIRPVEKWGPEALPYLSALQAVNVAERLRESESRFYDIALSSSDWIWEIDADGLYTYCSPGVTKILGYTPGELTGKKHFYDFFAPEEREQLKTSQLEIFSRKADFNLFVSRNLHKNGEMVILETKGVPILDRGGILLGYRGSVTDITERKRLEASLLQSEKLSAVGQLAAGVAHEINNPLGIILGFAQSVVRKIKEDDALALPLKTIEREAIRCKNLVQNLLVFSRASKSETLEELDLNTAMEGVLSLILAQAKARNVELVRELGSGLPKVNANQIQLQQVVLNLAHNAIDAMPKGGTLTIRTALPGRRPGYVELRVLDTGTGIPKDLQKRIFEPFFTTKEAGKGTGLGLSLAYEIIHKHGGAIELESEEGQGTEFTVYLPVHSAATLLAGGAA
ncbi:MAG: hypothetical protein A2270_08605 [Elusimicrobia bacterium RIFOXYA12_FULL_51_18]|nr:MAG: hypothetical protein A2270_08605 [Elusimicrobia bacterium RIFOXYA12_FULL_51_18]OGS32182.1 MAG: hypothetical protein A2218_07135 [Elusimicrobia bacterium RIFOXYA2_FULL_53_38]